MYTPIIPLHGFHHHGIGTLDRDGDSLSDGDIIHGLGVGIVTIIIGITITIGTTFIMATTDFTVGIAHSTAVIAMLYTLIAMAMKEDTLYLVQLALLELHQEYVPAA